MNISAAYPSRYLLLRAESEQARARWNVTAGGFHEPEQEQRMHQVPRRSCIRMTTARLAGKHGRLQNADRHAWPSTVATIQWGRRLSTPPSNKFLDDSSVPSIIEAGAVSAASRFRLFRILAMGTGNTTFSHKWDRRCSADYWTNCDT